ncbi:hypothetical protein ACS0TY_016008 [Phlomoides rotata]
MGEGSGSGGGGGGGDRSLSKLGIVLTIIFVVSLLALLAQLFYVLWRRRVFRRQTYISGGVRDGADHLSIYSSTESSFSSREFLFFFCMRSNSNSIAGTGRNGDRDSNRRLDMEVVDIDLLKIQGMFGPPRFLFTIKEEEREGFESPADKSMHSAEKELKKIDEGNRVSLEECFKAADAVVEVEIDVGGGNDATPFTTPCASPEFHTPSASPDDEACIVPITEEVGICCACKTMSQGRFQK